MPNRVPKWRRNPAITDEGRPCTKCGMFKPFAEFHKASRTHYGHIPVCRQCNNLQYRKRYYSSPEIAEKAKERSREWHRTHRDRDNAVVLRHRAKAPHKYAARQAVHNQLLAGKMKRLPCEKCGEPKTHAHHPDYSKPLEVVWLCLAHHAEIHRKYSPSVPREKRNNK